NGTLHWPRHCGRRKCSSPLQRRWPHFGQSHHQPLASARLAERHPHLLHLA
ncbi:unnamed protein product, partial [Effrenium voratum]